MRYGAPRIGRPRRHLTMVDHHAVESKLDYVNYPKEFVVARVSAGRDGRRPSQKLPSTAIYCHLVAAKPRHPLQTFYSFPLELTR